MLHPLADATRTELARYLRGEQSLDEFGDWFVPTTWDVEKERDPALAEFVYEIMLRLAEYSNGDCSEEELKRLLRPLVVRPPVKVGS